MTEASHEEKKASVAFWQQHAENLRNNNLVSSEGLRWINLCTGSPDKIGYEGGGQIRPGDLGKWDLYGILQMSGYFTQQEMLLLADLTASQLAQEERHDEMREMGIDPNDPADVAQFSRLKGMSTQELNREIAMLEASLEGE